MALKTEEVESNEPLAASLDEITTKQDTTTSALQSSLDASGHIRVVKVKQKGQLPGSTESLRRVLRVEGIACLCMSAKFKAKSWLARLEMMHWDPYINYVLGEKVHGIKIEGAQSTHRPSWQIVLQYEHRMRREAVKRVIKGQATLAQALQQVVCDADLKETYFTTLLALSAKSEPPSKHFRSTDKGWGKGKQASKGDAKGKRNKGKYVDKGDGSSNMLVSHTSDGREIC